LALTTENRAAESISNATYKLDVYFDYACPFAWAAQLWLDEVKDELGDDVDLTWRIFPLEQVNASEPDFKVWEQPNDGTSSTLRSFQAFHAAKKQGDELFKAFHAGLFLKRHEEGRNLGRQEVLEAVAEEAGLDMEQFRADLASDEVFSDIENDYREGRNEHEVFGTPTIVFENGEAAYLKLNYRDMPNDAVGFFRDFVNVVRDRPSVIEIKRPAPMGK
jgi:predicted DsbA family dithiol-disulfide isomerase